MKTIKIAAISALVIGAFCFGTTLNKTTLQDKHPHMNGAKKMLEDAKGQLQKATHDYAGHRVKAIEYVNSALKEINEGIAAEK